jgi:hypothetical protein
MLDVYEVIDAPPAHCESIASLYSWSTNFQAGEGPFTLLLDLIGWSDEQYGENLYTLKPASLGYMELGKLGDALSAYADHPNEVYAYVDRIISVEMGDPYDV